IVPELEAHGAILGGVYCLEFGHDLGLPDLYNTNTGQSILGPWELMDKGAWNGNPQGSSPAHMTAWDKIQLGYISGSTIATAQDRTTTTYTIDPTEIASNNIHAIKIPLAQTSQYYLVEVRALIGFDSALPAAGVLITLVNENLVVGKVHVIDGHPSVPNLNHAVWTVGQTFTDSANNVAVTVTSENGNSYQVTVNRGGAQPPPQPQNQNQTTPFIQLTITGINTQPAVIINPNTTVTISIQISNVGTIAATNVPIQVTLDGQNFTNLQVSNLAAGSSTQTSFTWISTIGSHVFQVTLDPNHTINEPSRANNVESFNVNVGPTLGPTLSINVPANITSSGTIWVLINGAKYNITSSQFQTTVPNGIITVEIQPAVNTSQGVRQSFTGWSDGNTNNPRQITVTSGTVLEALYATQYLLSINPNGGTATPSGWYQPNATVSVSANNPSNVTANASRFMFSSWSGDFVSNSTTLTVTMSKPVTLQANWIKQYYVTIISPTGTPSGEGWYNAGSVVTVVVQSTVQYPNGTRMIFNGWNSPTLGSNPTTQITVNSPISLLAAWKTQYLVTVQSEYGSATGAGWHDAGSSVQLSIQPEVDYNNETRRIFTGWVGDVSGNSTDVTLTISEPINAVAQWTTQYQITFEVTGVPNSTSVTLNLNNENYQIAPNQPYSAWYNQGQILDPTITTTVLTFLQFANWRDSAGSKVLMPITVTAPAEYTAIYVLGFPTA